MVILSLCFTLPWNTIQVEFVLHGNGLFILKDSLNIFSCLKLEERIKEISIFLSLRKWKLEPVKTLGRQAVYFHLTFEKHLLCKLSYISKLEVIPKKKKNTGFVENDKMGFQQLFNIYFLPLAGDSSNWPFLTDILDFNKLAPSGKETFCQWGSWSRSLRNSHVGLICWTQ